MSDLIAYYRLSREKKRGNGHAAQPEWGWSLENQQTAVDALARERCVGILARYPEIETGKRGDRPELAKTIAHAKRRGVKLGAARPEGRNLTDKARRKGNTASAAVVKQQADEAYVGLRDFFAALRPAFSFQQLADILNVRGLDKPPNRRAISATSVRIPSGPSLRLASSAAEVNL